MEDRDTYGAHDEQYPEEQHPWAWMLITALAAFFSSLASQIERK